MLDIFFVTSSLFLLFLVIVFSIGTVKVMYFSVFSPKKLNSLQTFLFFKTSSRRLQDALSVTIFRLPRRLQDVFAIHLQGVFARCRLLHLNPICRTPPPPTTSFSSVTSTNIGISPQNLMTFRFKPFSTLV